MDLCCNFPRISVFAVEFSTQCFRARFLLVYKGEPHEELVLQEVDHSSAYADGLLAFSHFALAFVS